MIEQKRKTHKPVHRSRTGSRALKLRTPSPRRPSSTGLNRKRKGYWRALMILGAPFAIVLVLLLLLIWQRFQVTELAGKIAVLETRKAQMQEENDRLLIRAEQLADYGRISRIAYDKFGLIRLSPQIILLSDEH